MGTLLLYVRLQTGETAALEMDPQATVGALLQQSRELLGTGALSWQGVQLVADDTELSDLGVCPESVVHEMRVRRWDTVNDAVEVRHDTGTVTEATRGAHIGLLSSGALQLGERVTIKLNCNSREMARGRFRVGLMHRDAFCPDTRLEDLRKGCSSLVVAVEQTGSVYNSVGEVCRNAAWECHEYELSLVADTEPEGFIAVALSWRKYCADSQKSSSSNLKVATTLTEWPDGVSPFAYLSSVGDAAVLS